MTADSWKTIFEVIGVVLLGFTFLDGGMAWLFSRRVNQQQADKLRAFQRDLTGAKIELSRQQERAANAERELESVRKAAADTQRQVALANQRAAEANERASELNKAAEELKAKNLALERAMTPRVLGIHGYDDPNLAELKQFAGTRVELGGIDDGEVLRAEGSIKWLLELAGWKVSVTVPVDPFSPMVKNFQHGVTLIPAASNDALLNARMLHVLMGVFSANGWKDVVVGKTSKADSNSAVPAGNFQLAIFVGLRPPAYELSPIAEPAR